MSYVADTDVLIDYLRGKGEGVQRIEDELRTANLATTAISAFELWTGVKGARETGAVEALISATHVLPLDADSAGMAAKVRRQLEVGGVTIGMADSLIAGICLAKNSTLITRNKKHFSRVSGLKIAD